jgi:O-antigen chain-terminating methyltransferase
VLSEHTVKRNHPRLDIQDLAAVIRESIASQTKDDKVNDSAAPSLNINDGDGHAPPEIPALKLQPDFQPRSDNRYHINDLLRYHNRTFVQSAYRAILKRSPDAAEVERALKSLQSGRLNKIDLLAALRFSVEGRRKQVQIDGLTFPALIRRTGRLPVVGYFIRLVVALLRLPKFVADQREFSGYVLAQNQHIADFVNSASVREAEFRRQVSVSDETLSNRLQLVDTLLDALKEEQQALRRQQLIQEKQHLALKEQHLVLKDQNLEHFGEIQQQLGTGLGAIESEIAAFKEQLESRLEADHQRLRTRIEEGEVKQGELLKSTESKLRAEVERFRPELQQVRAELTLQGRNINVMPGPAMKEQTTAARPEADAHRHDALYAALEDRFRGTREEIKERLSVYLEFIKGIANEAAVLDIGCGRGEWLELLHEDGVKASGVDMNSIQIEQCRERGLEVVEEDALVYLRNLPDKSVRAVTGFHIIEHFALDQLLSMLAEVMRVLIPGGVVIFETPNPENVLVGSNFFYLDPTHHHPLPSELMEFLLQNRGFHPVKVLNLHPFDSGRVTGSGALTERFNGYFYGPMDYAVVAWKTG